MIRLTLSAFQSITPAQLNVSQIMSPSENFLEDAASFAQNSEDIFAPIYGGQLTRLFTI